jgi:hypothetical protein
MGLGRHGRRRVLGLRLGSRRDDLDLAGLELRTQLLEIFLVEVVLVRERLEGGLLDRRILFRLLEEGGYNKFESGAHSFLTSFTRGVWASGGVLAATSKTAARAAVFRVGRQRTKKVRRAGDAFVHSTG